jgi:serine/threonine-protein kinase
VVGLSVQNAQTQVEHAGLNPIINSEIDNAPSGRVINQNPLGGFKLKSGATVTLTVSEGPGTVQVPTVLGQTTKLAIATLKTAGLNVTGTIQQTSTEVDKGDVISTSPDAGTNVGRGSGVTLLVSSGVQLPNVTGQTYQAAQQALSNFNVTTVAQTTTTTTPGTVVAQSPPANTAVASGSNVTLTVAQAPTSAAVPSLLGDTLASAQAALASAGFTNVTQKTSRVANPNNIGTVVHQWPLANKMTAKKAQITIWIGAGANGSTTATTPLTTTTATTTTATTTTSPTTT